MTIQFLCPSGHKISCPDEQAGRAAKCPKCGVKFRIPDLSELEMSDSDSDVSPPELESAVGVGAPAAEGQIEFLCPNGHRLHGPASLQGRPGQCPECGSKFRIPSYDEVPEEEASDQQQISVGPVDAGTDSGLALEEEAVEGKAGGAEDLDLEEPDAAEAAAPSHAAGMPRLARLIAQLWAKKAQGARVELRLSDGKSIAPDCFSEALSRGRHGVFAVKDPDGTYTLMIVAWESVARVLVRGVKELPKGMRE